MKPLTLLILCAAGTALVLAAARPAESTPPAAQYPTAAPVVVPYYGAAYGQPGGFSPAEAKRVVELLESIDRRLEAIEAKQGAPAAQKKGPDLFTVAKTNCAACHTPAKADAKGGGFILFADEQPTALKPLSGREKVRIVEAVRGGAMPPEGRKKLTADEKAAFKW